MRARDLQTEMPIVTRETTAMEAARLIAGSNVVGLVIADAKGVPVALVSAVDVLTLMLPGYLIDDFSLAAVFDEQAAEELWGNLHEHTIGELVDDDEVSTRRILTIEGGDTVVEVAARMADARTQLALVKDSPRDHPAFVTLPAVMDAILGYGKHDDSGSGA